MAATEVVSRLKNGGLVQRGVMESVRNSTAKFEDCA